VAFDDFEPLDRLRRRHLDDISLEWRGLKATCWLALTSALGLVTPYLLKLVVDDVVPSRDLSLLWIVVAVGIGVYALQSWSRYVGRWQAAELAEDVWHTLRYRAFGHLQRLSLARHRERDIADSVARIHHDTYNLRSLVKGGGPTIVEFATTVGGTVVALLVLAPELTLLGLTAIPALALTAHLFRDKVRPLQREMSRLRGEVYSIVHEGLVEAEAIKTYGLESHFDARVRRAGDELRETDLELARHRARLLPIVQFGISLTLLGVLGVGGHMVVVGTMQVGTLVAFFYYVSKSLGPIRRAPGLVFNWYAGVAAAERLSELFDTDDRLESPDVPSILPEGPGEVTFDSVDFSYRTKGEERDQAALRGLDVTLGAGERLAILGPSGSGKSTLGTMIPRLFDPDDGLVAFEGTSLQDVELDDWRRRVGYVGQKVALFAGTIADNIRFGAYDREPSDREIRRVASIAGLEDVLEAREAGLATGLGPDGGDLSGGERKRVALARALIARPDVLVLDQLAADLESALCRRIMQRVRGEFEASLLHLGHRVPEGFEPDRRLWMERGRIVSRGSPPTDAAS
jgi:ABC-type multidrug transport system fused ATPase/permease subunit